LYNVLQKELTYTGVMESLDPTNIRHVQLTGIIERICQDLELTKTQHNKAKSHYESVGNWLAESDNVILNDSIIYSQGSISLGTTVKPIAYNEFDVDLVCHTPTLTTNSSPFYLKEVIGERLKQHSTYREMLEEKPRCWRLNYTDEFHMDITPSIPNVFCPNGGELVPDKKLKEWKPSNPKGYKKWFEAISDKKPIMAMFESVNFAEARATIESFPEQAYFKGPLKRCVQICKRHRDNWFKDDLEQKSPISIIITTLAARSYDSAIKCAVYNNDLEILLDVVKGMPDYIEKQEVYDTKYFVWNPTTEGENFAEKWNFDPSLAEAFYSWQKAMVQHLEMLTESAGLDVIRKQLKYTFGDSVTNKVMDAITSSVSASRSKSGLASSPSLGLVVGAENSGNVRPNTFYGN